MRCVALRRDASSTLQGERAGCAPPQVAQAEALRTGGDVLRNEPNFVFDQKGD
jgi:hypothetical protein